MLKRGWGAESNGKLPNLFIPNKTATLVPEFAVEDLRLSWTAALVPGLQWKTYPWIEHSDDDGALLVLDNVVVSALVSKARGPGSSAGPG